ncbi:hypothetical protein ACFQ5J_04325 [Lacticaseibacillus baoqingensis]|uniref:Uncharacterized protein n=1 Tax=Lacticaseibacillus baoqingensis TaxID=2486013 RepID=A0ABW4E3F5_9LACO|nr:hypothetical protein [Lacticaseibacillus baoqingensis]
MIIRQLNGNQTKNILKTATTRVKNVYSKDIAFIATTTYGQYPTVFFDTVLGALGDSRHIRAVIRQVREYCQIDTPERQAIILAAFHAIALAKTGQHRHPAVPVSATRTLWTPFPIGAKEVIWFVSNRTQNFVVKGNRLYFETIAHNGQVIQWVVENAMFVPERVPMMQEFSQLVMAALTQLDAGRLTLMDDMLDGDYANRVEQSQPGPPADQKRLWHRLVTQSLNQWLGEEFTSKQIEELARQLIIIFEK